MEFNIRFKVTKNNFIGLVLLTVLAGLFAFAQYRVKVDPPIDLTVVSRDSMAKDFELETLDGGRVRLSDLRGKVVLINFWATWCPPCREEMPALNRSVVKLNSDMFVLLAVNNQEETSQIRRFVNEYSLSNSIQILLDRDGSVIEKYARALPSSFIVDKMGLVRYVAEGPLQFDSDKIIALLTDLINT